jgi:2-phospho-L-lactate guanylyltransferase (CobY/MobA/RfbA family)
MAKLSIIEIDLGININDIIQENVEAVTGDAKKQLDAAISVAKQKVELANKQKLTKQKSHDDLNNIMITAYEKLEQSGENGCLCSDILNIVQEHVANASAFSLRMKKILREKDNPYTLKRFKKQGNPRYRFESYNEQIN